MSYWVTVGSLNAAAAVALGAFGSHGLKKYTSDSYMHSTWTTASHYHLIHSIATIITPIVMNAHVTKRTTPIRSAQLFNMGILLFSGSLYLLVLSGEKRLGAITPIGGVALIGGWLALALRK